MKTKYDFSEAKRATDEDAFFVAHSPPGVPRRSRKK